MIRQRMESFVLHQPLGTIACNTRHSQSFLFDVLLILNFPNWTPWRNHTEKSACHGRDCICIAFKFIRCCNQCTFDIFILGNCSAPQFVPNAHMKPNVVVSETKVCHRRLSGPIN